MAESNKIRILLLVSLMIFPARSLDVILSGAHQDFKQKSEIHIDIMDGEKIYRGTLNQLTYEAQNGTSKVIVYIISRSRCIEILRPTGEACETRSKIAQELRESNCELVFLGIEHLDDDEYHLIGAFIFDKIRRHPNQESFNIETIGENRFDRLYPCHVRSFEKYQENALSLLARLRSIPHGAFRPVENNDKEIRLYGYQPRLRALRWPVYVSDGKYFSNVNLSGPKYDFMIKHSKKKKICLLILSGKEYLALNIWGNRGSKRETTKKILDGMTKKKEVLIIMGVFNFDWTEIDIVTQIILKHSEGSKSSDYNVFTRGYGMFNTYYRNMYEDDGRDIRQLPNSYVSEAIKVLMGEEMKERAINVYYPDEEKWQVENIPINLSNGRYVPEMRYKNFIVPCLHQKIAFIVYDRTEMNDPIDYFIVGQSEEELEQSGISVVLIEAFNFRLDDMHIIAEWIDRHSGVNDTEQIAVLGGGIFDTTIFQSESTTYNTFLNTKKNELEAIRNAYVASGNGKSVSVANIDEFLSSSNFEVWSYPMTTVVNGFYEPDVIPDKNMLDTTNGRKFFFIITSAYNFQQISAIKDLGLVALSFRHSTMKHYQLSKWSIYLVGLDNFEKKDCHLFAEFVKRQTKDERSLAEFVRVCNYGISPGIHQYKDNAPLDSGSYRSFIHERFTYFFGDTCRLPNDTLSTDTDDGA